MNHAEYLKNKKDVLNSCSFYTKTYIEDYLDRDRGSSIPNYIALKKIIPVLSYKYKDCIKALKKEKDLLHNKIIDSNTINNHIV